MPSAVLPSKKLPLAQLALIETLFRQLAVTTRIHDADRTEQIMLEASWTSAAFVQCRPAYPHAVNEDRSAIIAKVKTELLAARTSEAASQCAKHCGLRCHGRQLLNIAPMFTTLINCRGSIRGSSFLNREDKRSGYTQANGAPVMANVCFTYSRSLTTTATSPSAFLKKTAHGGFVDPGHCASPARYGGWRIAAQNRPSTTGWFLQGVLTQEELTDCIQAREPIR
jgi:hypothetical protein